MRAVYSVHRLKFEDTKMGISDEQIERQTIQWPNETGKQVKQWSAKHRKQKI